MALVPFGRRKAQSVNRDSDVLTGKRGVDPDHSPRNGGQSAGLADGDSFLPTRSGTAGVRGQTGTPQNRFDEFERMERSRLS